MMQIPKEELRTLTRHLVRIAQHQHQTQVPIFEQAVDGRLTNSRLSTPELRELADYIRYDVIKEPYAGFIAKAALSRDTSNPFYLLSNLVVMIEAMIIVRQDYENN
jgi:hypothetical protein